MSSPPDTPETGLVIRTTGSWHDVQIGEAVVPSKVRGKFRLTETEVTNPIAVGDRVTLTRNEDDTGWITEIHERRNKLSRQAAGRRAGQEHVIVANVDRVWAMQSVKRPRFNPGFIDRFLVMAEVEDIPAGLIINKADLASKKDRQNLQFWMDLYTELGYPVHLLSATTGEGITAFKSGLAGGLHAVSGPSGVGKSSLLNALEPELAIKTAQVGEKTNKGRHTTTYASLYRLSHGGFFVDTPGLREFGLWDLAPPELAAYFVEMRPHVPTCHFPSCTHDHEPQCAVKAAVDAGTIRPERYTSYLNMLESL